MYDPEYTRSFYDAYGSFEWSRLEATAYGRLQAIIHADFILRYLQPGSQVLDAGSGPGRFSIVIAANGGRVTVLDLSQVQLDLARSRLEESNLLDRVDKVINGDICDLSMFRDGQFNLVVCYGGALSYVCEHRTKTAAELTRVTKPDGILLVSVMSRFGLATNVVRRANLGLLSNPGHEDLWRVINNGELSGGPSTKLANMLHPPTHLYSSGELQRLFPACRVLATAGSNVSTFEGASSFEEMASQPQVWPVLVEIERKLCEAPGLVDSGSHIIMALQRQS